MTQPEIHIRQADIRDASLLCDLGIRTFQETFGSANTSENMNAYLQKTFSLYKIEDELRKPGTVYFLAYIHDQIAGYAKLRNAHPPEATNGYPAIELQRLYVIEDHKRKKIGKALLEHCIHVAQGDGFDIVWLGVWEYNLHAQNFYKNFGFKRFGEHIFKLGADLQTDFLMKKNLTK